MAWTGTETMFVFGAFGTFGTWLAQDCSDDLAQINENHNRIKQNQPKSPKVNMLKFGDVSFDLGFEW